MDERPGQRIEAGWERYRGKVLPYGAGEGQVRDMRWAFFAGAYFLFTELLGAISTGAEVTEADLSVMGEVDGELAAFLEEVREASRG